MLKKILIVFLLFLLLFFIFKDRLLKAGISHYLTKRLGADSEIGKARLLLNGVIIEDFSLSKGVLELKLEKARVTFNLFNRSIKDLKISNCNFQFKDTNANLDLKKSKGGFYILDVSSLKFKDKEIKDISIPLAIGTDTIFFNRIDSNFLGYSARISGVLNYRDYDNVCLKLSFKDTSFENVINLFSREKEFILVGDFDGRLEFCLDKGKISKIEGDFHNTSGGAVNIEKETSLGFLQRYLDKTSYDALVDNFKHYAYNKGRIKVTKKGGTVALNLDFGSDELGRRNVLVNLHNVLGGGK